MWWPLGRLGPALAETRPADFPRILGIVEGNPRSTFSGIPHFLLSALGRELEVTGCVDIAPSRLAKLGLAGASFRLRREIWRARFHTSALAHRVLSANLARAVRAFDRPFDLALQVGGWVGGQPRPYAIYLDQTRLQAERGWPDWLPLSSGERTRVLECEREMYSRAAHILVMGDSARSSLTSEYAIDAERITVVGGGLNFDGMPVACGPASQPAITFVGRDFTRKGGDCLLRAFRQVRAQQPRATLRLVGVREDVRQPGVESLGKIHSREQLAAVYRATRVFAMPSRYEPWGLAFVEAMAHGVPCVGTTVQSIPEILNHGNAGLLVPPGDADALAGALLRLLGDDDLARQIGQAGRRHVEASLTWHHVARRATPKLIAAARASG